MALLWVSLTLAMCARLVYLASYQRDFLLGQSRARVERQMVLPARRGRVLDRHGQLLAMSKPVNDLWTTPKTLLMSEASIVQIADFLDLNKESLVLRLQKNQHRDFMYLARNVEDKRYTKIKNAHLDSVYATQSYARFYPGGKASSQVVGIVDVDGRGIEGIEYLFDQVLAGQKGYAKYLINPFGETVESIERHDPGPGEDIQLTIDRTIQYHAYEALREGVKQTGAKNAHAVVVDVASGEIVAAAGYPAFDPQVMVAKGKRQDMRSRVFTDLFEPGSTFKPIALAYVLDHQEIPEGWSLQTSPGEYKLGRHVIRDVRDYGKITLEDVLVRSSNIGISKLLLASPAGFVPWVKQQFKVGQKRSRLFPGEPVGSIITKSSISDFELATLSFGYGLSVTPVQLAQMYMSIANGGWWRPVTLFKNVVPDTVEAPRRVMRQETADRIKAMLHKTTRAYGTARRARVAGMDVAGKTGTTHVLENGQYVTDKHIASFAGFAPLESPRYVVVVTVEEPAHAYHFGAQAAAPIFAKIIFSSQLVDKDGQKKN